MSGIPPGLDGWPAWGRASAESLVEVLRPTYRSRAAQDVVEVFAGLGRDGRRQRRKVGELLRPDDGTPYPRWAPDTMLWDWMRSRLGEDAHLANDWPTLAEAKDDVGRAARGRPVVEFAFAVDPIAPADLRSGRTQPVLVDVDVRLDGNSIGSLTRVDSMPLPDGSPGGDGLEPSWGLAAWLADRGIPGHMLRWTAGLETWASVLRLALGHEAALASAARKDGAA